MPLTVEYQIWTRAGMTPLTDGHFYPKMFEVSQDRSLRQMGISRVLANPWQYVRLVSTRAFHFWIGNRYYLFNGESGLREGFRQDAQGRGMLVACYSLAKRFLFIPGALLLAIWASWDRLARWREVLPLYAFPAGLTLGYIPFSVEAGRHVLPVLPCVFILAIVAIYSLRARLIRQFIEPRPKWRIAEQYHYRGHTLRRRD